jgi:hypothetical protein
MEEDNFSENLISIYRTTKVKKSKVKLSLWQAVEA